MNEYVYGTNASGGAGLGGTYKEYRAFSNDPAAGVFDEELQVWHWGNSYGTQYRDVTGAGGEARHQAWSFGGTATPTANMPTGGTASYNGRYGATSKTYSFIDDNNPLRKLSANGSWQVEGASNINVDFGTAQMTGTLTPQTWRGYETLNGGVGRTTVLSSNTADPNFSGFMNDNVILKGSVTGNTISNGTAELDPNQGWLSGVNPMYAGFFGAAGPNEVTGVYNFVAVNPEPIGGVRPINDDRRGFVQQSGVFHAQ
jgi:C-lobe and N-lobe beta barrels of Tf-binding protein B